jgi:hypothetical protein
MKDDSTRRIHLSSQDLALVISVLDQVFETLLIRIYTCNANILDYEDALQNEINTLQLSLQYLKYESTL